MIGLLLLRIARTALTILLVVSFAFVVLRLSGDPALEILSNDAPPDVLEAFRKTWSLDKPIHLQFLSYVGAVFTGDLGQSMRDGRDALLVVVERIPVTLAITLPALFLSVIVGVPAGVTAALKRNSPIDRAVMLGAIAGFTAPSFVLGLMLVMIFSVGLGWLPTGGAHGWRHAVLPIFTLGVGGAAILARYTRGALLEVLHLPYIRAASAKGVPWRKVVITHALPNAAIPTVTMIGFMVGQLIAGSVLVENVFSWPGVGRLLISSVSARDLAVVQCILFLVAATMIVSNTIVDLLHSALDPRTRTQAGRGQ